MNGCGCRSAHSSPGKRADQGGIPPSAEGGKAQKNEKLRLILETICGTGIRVSELKYLPLEAVYEGEAAVRLKGKIRVILISGKLRKALRQYIRKCGILSGPVFVTKTATRWIARISGR